jgi:hypothetical protein
LPEKQPISLKSSMLRGNQACCLWQVCLKSSHLVASLPEKQPISLKSSMLLVASLPEKQPSCGKFA